MTKIYVEPFVGSGAIFFDKEKSPINILNDLDKRRTDLFKMIMKSPNDPELYNKNLVSIKSKKNFIKKDYKDIPSIILKEKILLTGGFCRQPVINNNVYDQYDPYTIFQHIDLYQDKLKGVKILNQDYEKVMKQYDGPDTFFYLDPPYTTPMKDSSTGYVKGSDEFDYDRLNDVLQKIKGKFLMSLDNSQYIKQTFKKFKIKEITIPINRNPKFRKELLISNYDIHL